LRFPIRCLLDGRQFENFNLDVGYGDPVLEAPEVLTAPASANRVDWTRPGKTQTFAG
jgi:hypothetical protein